MEMRFLKASSMLRGGGRVPPELCSITSVFHFNIEGAGFTKAPSVNIVEGGWCFLLFLLACLFWFYLIWCLACERGGPCELLLALRGFIELVSVMIRFRSSISIQTR